MGCRCVTIVKHGLELGDGAPRLDSLDLSGCGARHKAITAIFRFASHAPLLRRLRVAHSDMTKVDQKVF